MVISLMHDGVFERLQGHCLTKMGQIEKTGTKEITMQGCSYDPKGSFGSEKVGG